MNKSRWLIALVAAGGAVGVCVLCIASLTYFNSVGAAALAPTRTAQAVAQIESSTAEAILSQTATLIATATRTNTPTDTPAPTNTPTATETLTATPTNTFLPGTETAIAKYATVTAQANALTATRAQYVANVTGTAVAVGATRTEQASAKTATAVSAAATKTFLAQFKSIDYRELAAYADNHIGEQVYVSGRVFNIIDTHTLQMWMGSSSDALYVETTDAFSSIYKNSQVVAYGIVAGFGTGTNAFGGTIKQPMLKGAFFAAAPPAPTAPPRPTPTPLPGGAVLIECHPEGGMANVGNVQSFFVQYHDGTLVAGNGATGQYMYSFQRAIYYATDGSGPFTFCVGKDW